MEKMAKNFVGFKECVQETEREFKVFMHVNIMRDGLRRNGWRVGKGEEKCDFAVAHESPISRTFFGGYFHLIFLKIFCDKSKKRGKNVVNVFL